MEGPAHLPIAGRAHPALVLVEGQAGGIPGQPQGFDEAAAFPFLVGDQVLVADLEDGHRQHGLPVLHQPRLGPEITGQVAEIGAPGVGGDEILEIARETRVHGVAAAMHDARTRQ